MRGARRAEKHGAALLGIIPAYAGSTEPTGEGMERGPGHPRVCGEHALLTLTLQCCCGIIPAYAGSTKCPACMGTARRDHPRVCGEHAAIQNRFSRVAGSSPRMRGAPHAPPVGRVLLSGSSPRMRGARAMHVHSKCICRIIPAYAGSTRSRRRRGAPARDHPRVCGEHALDYDEQAQALGSSPRMRGARFLASDRRAMVGIIPAYAGSTSACRACSGPCGDHPRVCGEHAYPTIERARV